MTGKFSLQKTPQNFKTFPVTLPQFFAIILAASQLNQTNGRSGLHLVQVSTACSNRHLLGF